MRVLTRFVYKYCSTRPDAKVVVLKSIYLYFIALFSSFLNALEGFEEDGGGAECVGR